MHHPLSVRRLLAAWAVAGTLLVSLPVAALAHTTGTGQYRSEVHGVTPAGLPVEVLVYGGDAQLFVRNPGTKELVVYGYTHEPYVRIGPQGVFVNTNSQAYYTNRDRFGGAIPPGVGTGAPKWKLVEPPTGHRYYTFHDHRIHWMLKTPPPQVDTHDPKAQKVTDWSIPFSYGSVPGKITGTLYYTGGQSTMARMLHWGLHGLEALTVLGFATYLVVYWLRRRTGAAPGAGTPASRSRRL